MTRKIFEGMKVPEREDKGKREYKPPEEELVDSGLVSRLTEHYINGRDKGRLDLRIREDFELEIETLMPLVKDMRDKFNPQFFIDSLIAMLKDEADRGFTFTRVEYLSAVIQALYDLNYSNEFVVNFNGWSGEKYEFGGHLQGKDYRPLTVNLYGDIDFCGFWAKHCNFQVHGNVRWCGGEGAEHSNFILHDKVKYCGFRVKNCTFDLMPGAEIEDYLAKEYDGNTLREMNKKGDWEIIPPESLSR